MGATKKAARVRYVAALLMLWFAFWRPSPAWAQSKSPQFQGKLVPVEDLGVDPYADLIKKYSGDIPSASAFDDPVPESEEQDDAWLADLIPKEKPRPTKAEIKNDKLRSDCIRQAAREAKTENGAHMWFRLCESEYKDRQ